MKSFKHHIVEYAPAFVKGWTLKSKIITSTTDYDNYHIKQVVNNPRKFGLNEKKILKILEDSFEDMSAPDPKEEAEKSYAELKSGAWDNNVYIEEYIMKKGYCSFVLDKAHGSVSGQTEKECREAANVLDDNYLPYERDEFKLFEVKPLKGKSKYITSKYDWNDWLEGRKKRKYVSKMAQFREWNDDECNEAEYQGKEVTLDDPFRLAKGEKKKFGVYVKNDKGNVVVVKFGDPNMEIKRDDPKRLKAYRSRMSCDDNPGPKWKANYWSCYQWRANAKVDN